MCKYKESCDLSVADFHNPLRRHHNTISLRQTKEETEALSVIQSLVLFINKYFKSPRKVENEKKKTKHICFSYLQSENISSRSFFF